METFKKEFVSYEQAVTLKELGFDEPCFKKYIAGCLWGSPTTPETYENVHSNSSDCLAPLKQQALRWFRKHYNLVHSITFKHTDSNKIEGINSVYYDIEIYRLQGGDAYKTYLFQECTDVYEEAEDICIDKLIETVKNK